MSQSQVKAARRNVRRLLGEEGAQTLQGLSALVTQTLVPTLEQHTRTHNQHLRQFERHDGVFETHDRQLCGAFERLDRLEAEAKAQRELTFAGRFRALLMGY